MNQKEYWDSVSEKKEFKTPFQSGAFQKYVTKESRIIDIGCGHSVCGAHLHRTQRGSETAGR